MDGYEAIDYSIKYPRLLLKKALWPSLHALYIDVRAEWNDTVSQHFFMYSCPFFETLDLLLNTAMKINAQVDIVIARIVWMNPVDKTIAIKKNSAKVSFRAKM